MPRSPCTNHPDKDVREITLGTKWCARCHHLIAPEPELAEETEAIKEVAEEALEEILEDIKEEEIPPEEPELEAEPEPSVEVPEKIDNTAEIEALRAKLAELEPEKK